MLQKNISSSKAENDEVRNRYAVFVQQHGEVYEDKTESLSPDDIRDIENQKQKITRYWILVSVVVGILALAISFDSGNFEIRVDALVVLVVVLAGGALLVGNFNKALKLNEKRVRKGVVTAKIRIDDFDDHIGHYLELSGKQKLKVGSRDYKICEVGEIIRIEMLTKHMLIKRKIIKLGKI